jgi:hypothetical protein
MYDPAGKNRILVRLKNEGEPVVLLFDERENAAVALEDTKLHRRISVLASPTLQTPFPKQGVAALEATLEGSAVVLYDQKGFVRTILGAEKIDGGFLSFNAADGKTEVWHAPK